MLNVKYYSQVLVGGDQDLQARPAEALHEQDRAGRGDAQKKEEGSEEKA